MFANSISRGLVLTAAAWAVATRAADGDFDPQRSSFAVSIESPSKQPLFFWDRFDYAFEGDVNNVFVDALQPFNVVKWNLTLPGKDFADGFRARSGRAARGAFVDSIKYGTREAIVETPFMSWLDGHEGWFADALRDSVDNVGEEAVAPLDVSYHAVEQTWWNDLLKNGGTHYGIRPFRTSPYAYVSHAINDGERTLFLANVRYYYDHFSDHRFELALSVPLAYGMAMDVGSSYSFGARDEQRCTVKLVKELKGGGIAHVGFEVREHPMIIAGITFGW